MWRRCAAIHAVELDDTIARGRSAGSERTNATAPATSPTPSASTRLSSAARASAKPAGRGPPIQRSIASVKAEPDRPMKFAIESAGVVGWPWALSHSAIWRLPAASLSISTPSKSNRTAS